MDADEFKAMCEERVNYDNIEVPAGEMSPRERFFAIMEGKKFDRIIDTEFGYWADTLKRWHKEGLPDYVDSIPKADVYFGFDEWRKGIPLKGGLLPSFPVEVIEDDGHTQIIYDAEHIKCQVFTDGSDTIPHYIDFPVKDRESYLPFKEKLLPKLAERLPADLAEIGEQVKDRNYVLQAGAGSTAGVVRNWMGFEGICYGVYDQPELIHEILADIATLQTALAESVVKHLSPDIISYWEDIAFKTGPILPPDFFNTECGPVYKKVMDVYRNAGTEYAYVDCDGDMRKLVPTWLDNGVNIMFPLEVKSGIHPETLRREYDGIRMMGGYCKTILCEGRDAIKKEMKRMKALADEGGFIPHIDHRVQADVAYDDYVYYLECKRDIFGLPGKIAE